MTGLIDSFNRTDAGSLGTPWIADPLAAFYTSHDIVSNTCRVDAGAFCADYYNVFYPAHQDVYATIVTVPSNAFRLYCRLGNVGTTNCYGYELELDTASATSYIVRMDNNVTRTTLLNLGTLFANGNKARLLCNGSTLTAYRDTGAGWVSVGTITDSTYAGGGYLGILSQNNTALTIDEFGGGDMGGGGGGGAGSNRLLRGT